MQSETMIEFHRRRARDELDLACRAESKAAMETHFRLSVLHMHRLHERTTDPAIEAGAR